MEFLVVGLNHRTAPFEIRERLAITKSRLPEALKLMGNYIDQGVILGTCNRSEVYTMGSEDQQKERVEQFLSDYSQTSLEDVGRYLYRFSQEECVHHLFRVASSLDSMILGEGQILRQVKDSFDAAVGVGSVQGPLSRLFHQALRVGKRVRRDTAISQNALSVSRACVELARRTLGDLKNLTVMVIGTGDAGKLAARALKDFGVERVVVTNRTYDRAAGLAEELGGEVIPFQDMSTMLEGADIVIGSTGSPGHVLEAEVVRRAMNGRSHRPLFLMDIAVPRDIDPEIAHVPNVHLYNMDDLETISESNRQEREREARHAREIVKEEVAEFLKWVQTLDTVPAITAIRQQADKIRDTEMAKLLRKLDHKLTPEETEAIGAMSRSIVNKLLHNPIVSLKGNGSPDRLELARELFNLKDGAKRPRRIMPVGKGRG